MEDKTRIFNMDCMDFMKDVPDNYYDLACVDPPYGILSKSGNRLDKYGTKHKEWDIKPPTIKYFNEVIRVSKNQIIWGGNYFPDLWKIGCKCFLFWYKHQPIKNWSSGELAWTSFNRPAMCFDYMCYGGVNQDANRFHPTQKPINLYDWCFDNFAQPGQKILDTHLGSGSSRIAAYKAGLEFDGIELDADYFKDSDKRFKQHKSQLTISF